MYVENIFGHAFFVIHSHSQGPWQKLIFNVPLYVAVANFSCASSRSMLHLCCVSSSRLISCVFCWVFGCIAPPPPSFPDAIFPPSGDSRNNYFSISCPGRLPICVKFLFYFIFLFIGRGSRAGWIWLAGRIWPAGRQVNSPDIHDENYCYVTDWKICYKAEFPKKGGDVPIQMSWTWFGSPAFLVFLLFYKIF